MERQRKERDVAVNTSSGGSGASGSAGPPADAPPAKPVIEFPAHRGLSQREAKVFFPPGYQLTKTMARGTFWQSRCPSRWYNFRRDFQGDVVDDDHFALQMVMLDAVLHEKTINADYEWPYELPALAVRTADDGRS